MFFQSFRIILFILAISAQASDLPKDLCSLADMLSVHVRFSHALKMINFRESRIDQLDAIIGTVDFVRIKQLLIDSRRMCYREGDCHNNIHRFLGVLINAGVPSRYIRVRILYSKKSGSPDTKHEYLIPSVSIPDDGWGFHVVIEVLGHYYDFDAPEEVQGVYDFRYIEEMFPRKENSEIFYIEIPASHYLIHYRNYAVSGVESFIVNIIESISSRNIIMDEDTSNDLLGILDLRTISWYLESKDNPYPVRPWTRHY